MQAIHVTTKGDFPPSPPVPPPQSITYVYVIDKGLGEGGGRGWGDDRWRLIIQWIINITSMMVGMNYKKKKGCGEERSPSFAQPNPRPPGIPCAKHREGSSPLNPPANLCMHRLANPPLLYYSIFYMNNMIKQPYPLFLHAPSSILICLGYRRSASAS